MSVKFKFIGKDYFDSFKDEPVNYTRKLVDFQQVDVTYNDFSKTFFLPASDRNNQLFQHYYDPTIIGGFNPFQKNASEMWVNGDLFSTGTLTLINIDLKDGKPQQYQVQFYSDTINLKEALQDKGLNQLQWSGLDHGLTAANALTYLSGTVVPGTNLRYPMASANNFWTYRGFAGVQNVRQIENAGSREGILNREVRPAIPVSDVLDQIFADAGYNYEVDFAGTDYYDDLYMWIHNGKDFISEPQQIASASNPKPNLFGRGLDGFGGTFTEKIIFQKEQVNDLKMYSTITGVTTISNNAPIAYNLVHKFDYSLYQLASVFSAEWRYVLNGVPSAWTALVGTEVTTALGALSSGDEVYMEIKTVDTQISLKESSYFRIENSSVSAVDYFNTAAYMPTMKCTEFIRGILVTFNAVMYWNEVDQKFIIQHREDWLNAGNEIDISNNVDTSRSSIKPPTFYKNYGFEFEEGEDFLNENYRNRNNRNYGGAFYDTGLYAGDEYINSNPFTPTIWTEVIEQAANGTISFQSNIASFFSVDQSFEKVNPGVRLMYYNGTEVASGAYKVVDVNGVSAGGATNYNLFTGYEATNQVNLAYNEELDFKGSGGVLLTDSLYTNFYQSYIQDIYNPDVRRLSIEAYIPYNKLKTIAVNDTLLIGQTKYLIDTMQIDLTTNKARLNLINKV